MHLRMPSIDRGVQSFIWAVVFFLFPRREAEERLLAQYHAEDTGAAVGPTGTLRPDGVQPTG